MGFWSERGWQEEKENKWESKSKKVKLEKLVVWGGVTDFDTELNVKDWIVDISKDKETQS